MPVIGIVAAWYETLRFSKFFLIAAVVVISWIVRAVKGNKRSSTSAPFPQHADQQPYQHQPFAPQPPAPPPPYQQHPFSPQPPPPVPVSPFAAPVSNGHPMARPDPAPERPRSTPLAPLLGGTAPPPPPPHA